LLHVHHIAPHYRRTSFEASNDPSRFLPRNSRPRSLSLRPQQSRQIKALAAFEELALGLCLLAEAEQADKTAGGVVIATVAALVGCQLLTVQAVFALAADHKGLALEQLDPHLSGDEALTAGHEGEQVLMEGTAPQSIIDYVGVFLRYQS